MKHKTCPPGRRVVPGLLPKDLSQYWRPAEEHTNLLLVRDILLADVAEDIIPVWPAGSISEIMQCTEECKSHAGSMSNLSLVSKNTQELTCQVRLLCPGRQTLHLEAPATGVVSVSRAVCVLRCCEVRLLQVPGR